MKREKILVNDPKIGTITDTEKQKGIICKTVIYNCFCKRSCDAMRYVWVIILMCLCSAAGCSRPSVRETYLLNDNWATILDDRSESDESFIQGTKQADWKKVNLPHNWDDYAGARQLLHGNLHGTAWYKREFELPASIAGKRCFIRFEGVGTYATVILNGEDLGHHLAGRVSFTVDVTDAVKPGTKNTLFVRAEHPEMISDMPWVCGGCSSEWGFSEGSQPFGIYRPVVLEVTDIIRIEPFGVHIWNDEKAGRVFIETEVKNYGQTAETIELVNGFNDKKGSAVFQRTEKATLQPGQTKIITQSAAIENPILWSLDNPYLYTLDSRIVRDGKTADEVTTPFGIRTVSWPINRSDGDNRFLLNGKPVFINGTCEYEHRLGQSHAFSDEEIRSRVKQIRAGGFNAFRDAHQPHNLLYQQLWDESGILFWTQFSAHIWYDTDAFRNNFKSLLRRWVKERRNSPSVIMWGLQNESVLPKAFAEECCAIIRQMDPTASGQRLITTCNGGVGTDWNVVQNWSGTYGGDPQQYDEELARPEQLLNGEYGAWRSIDLHTEGAFDQKGVWSEDRMCQLMESKVRLAEAVKDRVCGQFQWLFNSHDNPGRRQPDEGYRVIDKIGPFNYKGLLTIWGEPLDVYYMYRANYVSGEKDPMVYIVSHTWPDRFSTPCKAALHVYSNCDEVELFNDAAGDESLGKRRRNGVGTHFVWNDADIQYNVLYAVGYREGKPVAEDVIILDNLPRAPHFEMMYRNVKPLLKAEPEYHYIYRVNCGGDAYTDTFGRTWSQDVALGNNENCRGSRSWADDYPELNSYLASQRRTFDPIDGTRDWMLFQTFRYGRHKLAYHFPVPDGTYRVELYFIEPWYGTGGAVDCRGLRIFDVAVNDTVCLNDLDIWAEAGSDAACKKVITATVTGGSLDITFPEVKVAQAVISAIAVASSDEGVKPAVASPANGWSWNDIPRVIKTDHNQLPEGENRRPKKTYEARDASLEGQFEQTVIRKRPAVRFDKGPGCIEWDITVGLAQVYALRFTYMNTAGHPTSANIRLTADDGTVLKNDEITFPDAGEKWRMLSTTTECFINAGHYTVRIEAPDMNGLCFDKLDVQ